MSYDVFKRKVNALIRNAKLNTKVRFHNDTDKGKYIAYCGDDVQIIGTPCGLKVTVKWGSGHTAMASI